MGLIIKTKNKVTNLDGLNQEDAYGVCNLLKFDILDYKYELMYQMIVEEQDHEGNPMEVYKNIEPDIGYFNKTELQQLFELTGLDITTGENFNDEMREIIGTALIYKMINGSKPKFGISVIGGWEIVQ